MTTIASKVCHHCCNPNHMGTCWGVGAGSGAAGGFFGVITACFAKPTLTGIVSIGLGGGVIGACAGASAVIACYAKHDQGSGDSKTVVVDYNAHSQPSITTRVVSKQPSWGGRGYGFNPDSSYYYDSHSSHAFECSDGGHSGGHSGCSDGGGSGGGDC